MCRHETDSVDQCKPERLFVYGSLQPGGQNAHILNEIGGRWSRATVRGMLKEAGWGAAIGFPGLVIDKHGDEVPGRIFESQSLADHWNRLDEFEGDEYRREICQATRSDGSTTEVYVYALRRADHK